MVGGAGCAGISEGLQAVSKIAAYKMSGHKYLGRNNGRGGRSLSKIVKALKGVASYDLLDAVARDDAFRRMALVQGNSSAVPKGVARDSSHFLQN